MPQEKPEASLPDTPRGWRLFLIRKALAEVAAGTIPTALLQDLKVAEEAIRADRPGDAFNALGRCQQLLEDAIASDPGSAVAKEWRGRQWSLEQAMTSLMDEGATQRNDERN